VRALPLLFIVLLLVVVVLWPLLRRRQVSSTPVVGRPHELVKDPVCQTYVVRSRAIRPGDGSPYFCSAACAERWAAGPRG
jgi:YHS domain-containing protein